MIVCIDCEKPIISVSGRHKRCKECARLEKNRQALKNYYDRGKVQSS